MMKLYGSTTSPYVRRIRMLLSNIEHDFISMHIFAGPDRDLLLQKNPTLKVPMLEDGTTTIFDSRVIFRYLTEKYSLPKLSWPEENLLSVIDSVNDSLVQLLLLQRSEVETDDSKVFFRLHNERLSHAFQYLNEETKAGAFSHWEYPAICLFCLVDWAAFRQLHDLSLYPELLEFVADHKDRIEATATDPRD